MCSYKHTHNSAVHIDPITKDYPWYTPYQFAGDKPIWAIDRDGLEELVFQYIFIQTARGELIINKIRWEKVALASRAVRDKGSFWVDNTKPTGVQYSITYFENRLNEIQFGGDVTDENSSPIEVARKIAFDTSRRKNFSISDKDKTVFVNRSFVQFFSPDKGKTKEELDAIDEINQGDLTIKVDNLVSTIVNADPNAIIEITGFASPIATNISGSENETSVENNNKLAAQRAQAMADFIINFAKENFNGLDISGNIQIVNGGIRDATTTSTGNSTNDQRTEVKLKRADDTP